MQRILKFFLLFIFEIPTLMKPVTKKKIYLYPILFIPLWSLPLSTGSNTRVKTLKRHIGTITYKKP